MKIIGITGTLGAGKGTIVEYLITQKGFVHYSVRAYLIEEIEKRNMPVDRNSMVVVANELRARYGPAYIVEQLYNKACESGQNCIIESLRTPGEVEMLKKKGNFVLFAVDADPAKRYERIILRNSETDSISFETFIENEKREMLSEDPNHQNIQKCMDMADKIIRNEGSREELYTRTEEALQSIGS
jgi:dephospho-CoA kinase